MVVGTVTAAVELSVETENHHNIKYRIAKQHTLNTQDYCLVSHPKQYVHRTIVWICTNKKTHTKCTQISCLDTHQTYKTTHYCLDTHQPSN